MNSLFFADLGSFLRIDPILSATGSIALSGHLFGGARAHSGTDSAESADKSVYW